GGPGRRDVPPPAAGECRRGGTSEARPAGRITEFLDLWTSGARFVSRRRNMERLLVVGGWRSLAARTVRDREAPGSNPGPPTSFVFKTGDFWRRPESTGHSRGTDSPGTRRLSPVPKVSAELRLNSRSEIAQSIFYRAHG